MSSVISSSHLPDDATEELWLTYYENIFNPARLKAKAMQKEMPKKYWKNLPEAPLIPRLVAGAESAAREMIEKMPTMPAPHHAKVQAKHWPTLPAAPEDDGAEAGSIADLRKAAEGCRRCPLWRDATQTVFGEGPDNPAIDPGLRNTSDAGLGGVLDELSVIPSFCLTTRFGRLG